MTQIKTTLVNQTGDGIIKLTTSNRKIIDLLLENGYHVALPGEAARAMQKARRLDKLAAERQSNDDS